MAMTQGLHHVGLTVSQLEASAAFFIDVLGFHEVKRNPDYPAIFVSDGYIMLTLWAVQTDEYQLFDRKRAVGLHHLALQVESEEALQMVYERLKLSGVAIEFGPELVKSGPAKHLMCFEPSGIRIELFWRGQ